MKPEHRIWWEELADQYEEWAYEPPWDTFYGEEEYTCEMLEGSRFGFSFGDACGCLRPVWFDQYGHTALPAGSAWGDDRAERREAFCWYMADTIREALGE